MATVTWNCNKDTRIAHRNSDGLNQGAGASDYLPIGLYDGYVYRSLLGFSYSFSGMVSITAATLHVKTSSQHYVAFGGSPTIFARRITASWSEGSADGLSTGNATVYPGPSTTTTSQTGDHAMPTAENTWTSFNVLGIVQDAMSAGTFQGIELFSSDESTTSKTTEIYAREFGSNDAYIEVTYSTNQLPTAPTVNTPTNNQVFTTTTPTLSITHNDPDGDPPTKFDMQVAQTTSSGIEPSWAILSWSTANDTSDLTNPITKTVGTALSRGFPWYAFRARTSDASGFGPWSSTKYFKIAALPTATVTTPSNGHTARLFYTAGSNTTPKFNIYWTFSDTDGHTQSSVVIKIYNDSSGSVGSLAYSTTVSGTTNNAQLTGFAPTNGTYYWISVTPTCSAGLAGTESTKNRTRARWGRASYYFDTTTAPAAFGTPVVTSSVSGSQWLITEYTTTSSTTEPTTWYTKLTDAGDPQRYIWHRVTMSGYGSATPSSPSVSSVKLVYTNNVPTPDNWTLDGNSSVDSSVFVYGTQSLKIKGAGVGFIRQTTQVVSGLQAGLVYVLSGRIKSSGDSEALIQVRDADNTTTITGTQTISATQDFGDLDANNNDKSLVSTDPFIAPSDTVTIRCVVSGAVGTTAWFDAIKLEQSSVVTQWTPGFVSGAVSLDAGGIQVDGSSGGAFRLRGSTGGDTDTVELYQRGLLFGGDLHLYRNAAGELRLQQTATGDAYLRTISDSSTSSYSGFLTLKTGDTTARSVFGWSGDVAQNGMFLGGGSGARDTNLYRSAANVLTSDDKLDAASVNLQVKAGTPVDGDIVGGAASGDIVIDTTASKIWVRVGSTWKSVTLA